MQSSNVVAVPAFADHDIRLLHDGTQAVVVDPGHARPVKQALEQLRSNCAGILGTHHRVDQSSGVSDRRSPAPQPQKKECRR